MDFAVLGWPPDGPTMSLDHERFAYAGKFVMGDTGKAVALEDGTLLGAVAFSPDRTDESTLRLRYVTVRRDRQGEGIGPRLLRLVTERATARGFESVLIAVNNPHAYVAAYRAGFGYTGDETGMAELLLAADAPRDAATYRDGLSSFESRDLPAEARTFVERRHSESVPAVVEIPD